MSSLQWKSRSSFQSFIILSIILILTFVSFSSSLKNGYVNWDDPVHFLDAPTVRSLDISNVKTMFSETINTTYIPLTTLSFAVEYKFFKFNPKISHAINIFLHLIVVSLVFLICFKLNFSLRASVIATTLFAIHPMRAESIAWVTERKDVLYAVFYLSAVLLYLNYLEKRSLIKYFSVLILGLLSMLCKPMALSLPLILILIDYYKGRRDWGRVCLEKLPIFLYVGLLALISVKENHDIFFVKHGIYKAILTWIWSFSFYILKFLWPVHLAPFYPIPQPMTLTNISFLVSIFVFISIIYLVFKYRANRLIVFSFLFYFLSIFFLLRINPEDLVVVDLVADRFIYLPCLGFCFYLGFYLDQWLEGLQNQKSKLKNVLLICLIVTAMALMLKTFDQCRIWKDSLTMWGHVLKHNPNTTFAYISRGTYYEEHGEFDLALTDYNKATELFPAYIRNYTRRGILYGKRGEYDLALNDFNYILKVRPHDWNALTNRGNIYKLKKDYSSAIADYTQAVQLNPDDFVSLNSRGECLLQLGKLNEAIEDFNRTLKINPAMAAVYTNRGLAYAKQNQFDSALEDFNKALLLNPRFVKTLFYRAALFQQRGEPEKAIQDQKRAAQIMKGGD